MKLKRVVDPRYVDLLSCPSGRADVCEGSVNRIVVLIKDAWSQLGTKLHEQGRTCRNDMLKPSFGEVAFTVVLD